MESDPFVHVAFGAIAEFLGPRILEKGWDGTRGLLTSPRTGDHLLELRQGLAQALANDLAERGCLGGDEPIDEVSEAILKEVIAGFLATLGTGDALSVVDFRAEDRHRELLDRWELLWERLGRRWVPDAQTEDPAKLVAAKALLESLPVANVPDLGTYPACSLMLDLPANPMFVGRRVDLQRMAASLKGGGALALGQVAAVSGMGGVGKTQLALEFVHRYGRFFAGGVFWLSFASVTDIGRQVAACGGPGAMDLRPGFGDLGLEERVALVRQKWHGEMPRLLVFDNCEEEDLLRQWRPITGGCRVLVTTRRTIRESWPLPTR